MYAKHIVIAKKTTWFQKNIYALGEDDRTLRDFEVIEWFWGKEYYGLLDECITLKMIKQGKRKAICT